MEEVFIYNRDHYRETQPNAVYHRVVDPNECIYKMPPLPTPKTQGTLLKRWQKKLQEPEDQAVPLRLSDVIKAPQPDCLHMS